MSWYCDFAPGDPLHGPYHDEEYGFPRSEESVLFERLVLEIMQAGLSWGLILRKRPALRDAFDGFDVDRVAGYEDADVARLLADAGIIRNRLKIAAVIENARRIRAMRESHGGFAAWIAAHHPRPKSEWVKLFKKALKFTGGEVTGEFLMSLGYLPGAHRRDCPAFAQIERMDPPWMSADPGLYVE